MSAFSFINEPHDASDEYDYVFGDEFADQSQSSDIFLGSVEDQSPDSQTTKINENKQVRSSMKKSGSRVIGKNQKKPKNFPIKKSASSKFGKKITNPVPKIGIVKNTNATISTSKFDVSFEKETLPTQATFDHFLSANSSDPEAPNSPESNDKQLSTSSSCKPNDKTAFSFMNEYSPELREREGTDEFSFEADNSEERQLPLPKKSPASRSISANDLKSLYHHTKKANVQSSMSTVDNANPFLHESDDERLAFKRAAELYSQNTYDFGYIRQLQNFNDQAKNFHDKILNIQSNVSKLEKDKSEAISNEKFDAAEQMTRKINSSYHEITECWNGISTAIERALNLANDAPNHMNEHSLSSKKEIPQLRVRESALTKRLNSLVELQETDKQKLEFEKSKVASTITEINAPIIEQKKRHAELSQQLEKKIADSKKPFLDKIDQLTLEKEMHNQKISELQALISAHKQEIKNLFSSIKNEERLMKKKLEIFLPEQRELKNYEMSIANEEKTIKQKQKELESPYHDLQENVTNRDNEITQLSAALESVKKELHDAEQDVDESQSASDIILEICSYHSDFKNQRSSVKKKFDEANNLAQNASKQRNQISMEITTLLAEKEKTNRYIEEAKFQIPQLDSSKKAYVASKNFKGAQQVSNQLKEIQDKLNLESTKLNDIDTRLSQLQSQEHELKANSFKLFDNVDDAKIELNSYDYAFYSKASDLLIALCHSSPYAAKLLAPLKDLVEFACLITQPPKEFTKEELTDQLAQLNEELNKAVNEENFDAADDIQQQIEKISSKIERMDNSK